MEYDLFHFEHQVPGGMVTNFTRQLREIKMEHRLDEILEEAMRVRREYGYPVMATPYSQIVGVQAFENVVSGERYKHVTDESIKYLLGYYGEPAYPLDQDLLDRVMSLPRDQGAPRLEARGVSEVGGGAAAGAGTRPLRRRPAAQGPHPGQTREAEERRRRRRPGAAGGGAHRPRSGAAPPTGGRGRTRRPAAASRWK